MHAWIPIVFLPICPKRVNKIPGYSIESQEIQALQTVHDVLAKLLKPLSDDMCQTGYEMVCADGNVRLCFPKLFCWLADHMENATIHCMSSNRYPVCTTPTEKLGEYLVTGYPIRSHEDYAIAYRQSDAAGLNAHGMTNVNNALWSIPCLSQLDLVRADILHNILLAILDYLMNWIQGFLEQHNRINAFDYVWCYMHFLVCYNYDCYIHCSTKQSCSGRAWFLKKLRQYNPEPVINKTRQQMISTFTLCTVTSKPTRKVIII